MPIEQTACMILALTSRKSDFTALLKDSWRSLHTLKFELCTQSTLIAIIAYHACEIVSEIDVARDKLTHNCFFGILCINYENSKITIQSWFIRSWMAFSTVWPTTENGAFRGPGKSPEYRSIALARSILSSFLCGFLLGGPENPTDGTLESRRLVGRPGPHLILNKVARSESPERPHDGQKWEMQIENRFRVLISRT